MNKYKKQNKYITKKTIGMKNGIILPIPKTNI